ACARSKCLEKRHIQLVPAYLKIVNDPPRTHDGRRVNHSVASMRFRRSSSERDVNGFSRHQSPRTNPRNGSSKISCARFADNFHRKAHTGIINNELPLASLQTGEPGSCRQNKRKKNLATVKL